MNVISASRRTDLPAFHWDWFTEQVRQGSCEWVHPFNPSRRLHASLAPEDVVAFVFWTRNGAAMLPDLAWLEREGYTFYIHYTVTGYPRDLEPKAPNVRDAVATLRDISQSVGPDRVIWRYDPIVFSTRMPAAYHVEQFSFLARELRGAAKTAVISFCDSYRATRQGFSHLAGEGGWAFPEVGADDRIALAHELAAAAAARDIELRACAEPELAAAGLRAARCIDPDLLAQLRPDLPFRLAAAPTRPGCGCARSIDIGTYGTCRYGCVYCYARSAFTRACETSLQAKKRAPSRGPAMEPGRSPSCRAQDP